ncbi:MAG: PAS domain S-box protein, partial [Candidatus Acidiferrales bacterium]
MKTKSLFIRKVQLAFGSAILILLVVGVISYRGIVVSSDSDRWVRHTDEVIECLHDSVSALQTIESAYRGFALTGSEEYSDAFRSGVLRLQQDQISLRNLTVDNPVQVRQFPALDRLAEQKIEFGESVIGLRRTNGLEAAAELMGSREGQRITEKYGEVIGHMLDEEQRLLVLRSADAKQRLAQSKTILILGIIVGLFFVAAAGWSVKRDSVQRGLAEEALEGSKEQYRMLLDGVQDYAIFLLDTEGKVVSWNAGAERISGYSADQIIGRNFSSFFSPEDIRRGKPAEILRLAAESGRYEEQGTRVRKDGSRFVESVTLAALRDHAGQLQGFSEISRDLSESKESGAKYRGLLEAAPDAMVVVNQGGEIVLLNVRAEKQFGYRRDELVGQKVTNIIPDGFAERLIADGTRSAADALAQQIGTGIELTARRKDGSEFPIEIMLSPLESPEGILVTAAIRDISVRRAAEKRVVQMEGRYRGLLEAAPDAMV